MKVWLNLDRTMHEHDYSHSALAIFRADELILLFKAKRKTKHCRIVRNALLTKARDVNLPWTCTVFRQFCQSVDILSDTIGRGRWSNLYSGNRLALQSYYFIRSIMVD